MFKQNENKNTTVERYLIFQALGQSLRTVLHSGYYDRRPSRPRAEPVKGVAWDHQGKELYYI